jgi:hypothetical protein
MMGRMRSPLALLALSTLLSSSPAHAHTPEEIAAALAAVSPQRELRIQRSAPTISETDIRKVAGGSVVASLLPASEGNRAYGAAIVPLPIGRFWAALNDETRHPGYTAIAYSEILSGSACRSGRHVLQYLPIPFIADRWWIGVLTANARLATASGGSVRELAWQSSTDATEITSASGKKILGEAVPIGFSKGAWFLVALDERSTWVEYYTASNPGDDVPGSMASMFVSRGVREAIAAITRFAQEGHPACPLQ